MFMKNILIATMLCTASISLAQGTDKDPYFGLDKKEITNQFGKPTTIQKDGNDGEMLIYIRQHVVGGFGGKAGVIRQDRYVFYLNKAGKVYSWKVGERAKARRPSDELF
jgi:hypothetical protein